MIKKVQDGSGFFSFDACRAQALHLVEEMKVNVKILQGAECNVDVTHGDSVETLKVNLYLHCIISSYQRKQFSRKVRKNPRFLQELVKAQLNISPSDQKLMLRGKKLQEGTLLGDYNLREGDRLHLVVRCILQLLLYGSGVQGEEGGYT